MESQLGSLGIPPGWFSGLGSSQPTGGGSWEGLSELPTHGYKLRHQTQGRPRPPRTTPPGPGRPSVSPYVLTRGPTSLSNAPARGSSFRIPMPETLALGDQAGAPIGHQKEDGIIQFSQIGNCCLPDSGISHLGEGQSQEPPSLGNSQVD